MAFLADLDLRALSPEYLGDAALDPIGITFGEGPNAA